MNISSGNQINSLQPSQTIRFLLSSLPAFFIGLAFGMGKIVRDCSITCNVGYQLAPVAILAIGIVAFPVSSITLRQAGRLGYSRWQTLSLGTIAGSFLLFWFLSFLILTGFTGNPTVEIEFNSQKPLLAFIYLSFYVWLGAVGATLAPNIKSTVYKLFTPADRSKALAITSSAVICGGLVGAFIASWLAPLLMKSLNLRYELARDSLILAMALKKR